MEEQNSNTSNKDSQKARSQPKGKTGSGSKYWYFCSDRELLERASRLAGQMIPESRKIGDFREYPLDAVITEGLRLYLEKKEREGRNGFTEYMYRCLDKKLWDRVYVLAAKEGGLVNSLWNDQLLRKSLDHLITEGLRLVLERADAEKGATEAMAKAGSGEYLSEYLYRCRDQELWDRVSILAGKQPELVNSICDPSLFRENLDLIISEALRMLLERLEVEKTGPGEWKYVPAGSEVRVKPDGEYREEDGEKVYVRYEEEKSEKTGEAVAGATVAVGSGGVKIGEICGIVYIETPGKEGVNGGKPDLHYISGAAGFALKKFLQQQRVDDAFKVFGIPVAVSPSLKDNEMALVDATKPGEWKPDLYLDGVKVESGTLVDAKDKITQGKITPRPVDPLPENYTVGVDLADEPSKTVQWYMEGDALKAFLQQEAEFQKRDAVSSVENFFKLRQEEGDQDAVKQEEKHEVSEEEFVQSDFSEAAFMEAWAGRIQPTAGAIFCGKGATQISEGKAQPSKSGWFEEDFLKRDPAKPQKQQVENPDPEKKSENSLAGNTQEKVLKKLTSIGDRLDELRDFWAKNQIQRDAEIGPVVGFCAYCSHERRAGQNACANCGCRVMTSYARDVSVIAKKKKGITVVHCSNCGTAGCPACGNGGKWASQPDQVAREEAAMAAKHEKAMGEAMEREKQILKKQYEEMAESMGFSDGSMEEASNDTADNV